MHGPHGGVATAFTKQKSYCIGETAEHHPTKGGKRFADHPVAEITGKEIVNHGKYVGL